MAKLGIVGLGVMGGRMVKRLLDAGMPSPGTITHERRQTGSSSRAWHGLIHRTRSPRMRTIISMVTNTKAVESIEYHPGS